MPGAVSIFSIPLAARIARGCDNGNPPWDHMSWVLLGAYDAGICGGNDEFAVDGGGNPANGIGKIAIDRPAG